jgi:predicted nucleic acid-binding protein
MNRYFWDSNILRLFSDNPEHSVLRSHIERVSWDRILLPCVVVAESWRGRLRRIDTVPKAKPEEAVFPYQKLIETNEVLRRFTVLPFDEESVSRFLLLQQDMKRRKKSIKKRHADMMIAAMTLSYDYILVTRNEKDFAELLPAQQIENWIDSHL